MRPINKGVSPYKKIPNYSDALPFLEKCIGLYCSYCEFRIDRVPEVEHIISKSEGGDKTAWDNLLLGCKYCNSRKSKKITQHNKDEYLWPDI
ncbi:MAG: HNH endonuclease [Clostridiaceae bacterium]|nr:HNH endonuclease [Clostridiaceae bacterium]